MSRNLIEEFSFRTFLIYEKSKFYYYISFLENFLNERELNKYKKKSRIPFQLIDSLRRAYGWFRVGQNESKARSKDKVFH